MKEYNHREIEKKWRGKWQKDGLYKTSDDLSRPKCYVLDMFPYPSGEGLHVGHPKGYIATDIYSRFKRMNGFNVLHPMGWDAFGLPAENYALKTKTHPRDAVSANIERFKKQLSLIGFNYDWDREINTTDPAYYKWTQWIFLKLFEKGLAYEAEEPINWCPKDMTGLANEDVENGKCERCGTLVEKKLLRQWKLKITKYAGRLLEDLDNLDWPISIKESQRNWIGKSEGSTFKFEIRNSKSETNSNNTIGEIEVFTTRADTFYGVTYLVVAPEYPWLIEQIQNPIRQSTDEISNKLEIDKYLNEVKNKTEIDRTDDKKERTGVEIKGVKAIHPATGEELPVWVADYVLADYGTGAVMAVPAHDERDFEFAQKYKLAIREVVVPLFTREGTFDAWRKNEKETIRPTVVCLIKHWSENKYLFLKKKIGSDSGADLIVAVAGGVDEGEDLILSGKREIEEETGYNNAEFVKSLGTPVFYRYFSINAKQNRNSVLYPMYYKLKNETSVLVSDSEKDLHDTIWLKEEEIPEKYFPGRGFNSIFWDRLQGVARPFLDEGMLISSGEFNHAASEEGRSKIAKKYGQFKVTYKLRDWVFSRQRYWGEPIPMVHCEKCGIVPVPEKDLPVLLPEVDRYEPTGTGESPLANITEWVNVACPKCGGAGKRETNTMPQWAGSSWYYLRYTDPHNDKELAEKGKIDYWLGDSWPLRSSAKRNDSGVDMYVGGAEHATRHLIYARFWHKFLFDIGVVGMSEPFRKLQNVGLIGGADGRKMSKRFGNVVNPDRMVELYGADTFRLYEMFMGPFDQAIPWNTDGMMGPRRFIERIWRLQTRVMDGKSDLESGKRSDLDHDVDVLLHRTIKKVSDDIQAFKFNTAISALMILSNELEKKERAPKWQY